MPDNAAVRDNFACSVYEQGVAAEKKRLLEEVIPKEFSEMHLHGDIHIHDLESFGKVYNCSTPDLLSYLSRHLSAKMEDVQLIIFLFEEIKNLITHLANLQSGGIGLGNFDCDLGAIFTTAQLKQSSENVSLLSEMISGFLFWINNTRTRFCREKYYITLNVGLATDFWGRTVTEKLLDNFIKMSPDYTRPNIVFKVKNSVNSSPNSPNYDLFQKALICTAKRMIPTYYLTDSVVNMNYPAESVSIMGCRTRVCDNINGEEGTIGRGNIAYISINLPRIALQSTDKDCFFSMLKNKMESCCELFLFRNDLLLKTKGHYLKYVFSEQLWRNVQDVNDMLRQGTYSIGFIGLSETVEILTGKRVYQSPDSKDLALEIVRSMRSYADKKRSELKLNISVLATPGEMLSGRFCAIDSEQYQHPVLEKRFYTNSFHINVDAGISLFDKIKYEAPYHAMCNGGCITYIEFSSALLENTLALQDALTFAEQHGISYMGFNYPLDICKQCHYTGTYDNCPCCGSDNIRRIRRVSGYLEDANYFTEGKKAELRFRKPNVDQ